MTQTPHHAYATPTRYWVSFFANNSPVLSPMHWPRTSRHISFNRHGSKAFQVRQVRGWCGGHTASPFHRHMGMAEQLNTMHSINTQAQQCVAQCVLQVRLGQAGKAGDSGRGTQPAGSSGPQRSELARVDNQHQPASVPAPMPGAPSDACNNAGGLERTGMWCWGGHAPGVS